MTGTSTRAEMVALADRFFAAIEAGDIEAVRGLYAPDAVIWHNTDGIEQPAEENLSVLRWIATRFREFRYEDRRCEATDAGFVEQHVTRGIGPGGEAFAMPACLVCRVSDGRISRVDEYLDSAQVARMLGNV